MAQHETTPIRLSRRDALLAGAALGIAALAGRFPEAALAFPGQSGDEVLPWLDQPAPNAAPDVVGTQLVWEQLDSWITPNDQFFTVHHYPVPTIAADGWRLKIDGLVGKPLSLCLADLRARPRQEVTFTLECSGNSGFPWLTGAVGNATWAGTPLAPILQEAGILGRRHRGRLLRRRQRRGGGARHQGHRAVRPQHVGAGRDGPEPHPLLRDERRAAAGDARRPGAADRAGLVRGRERQVAGAHPGAADALRGAVHGAGLRDDAHRAARRRHA